MNRRQEGRARWLSVGLEAPRNQSAGQRGCGTGTRSWAGALILLVCLALLSACASSRPKPLKITKLEPNFSFSRNPGKAVVVGSIEVKGFEGLGIRVGRCFELCQIPTMRGGGANFSSGKPFFLVLDPGEYQIGGIFARYGLLGAMGYGQGPVNPSVDKRFTADKDKATYIGKLVCTVRQGYYDHLVLDEFEQAKQALQAVCPNVQPLLEKRLMR